MLLISLLAGIAVFGVLVIFSHLVFLISAHRDSFHIRLSILRCGLAYHSQSGVGIFLGKRTFYKKIATKKKPPEIIEEKVPEPQPPAHEMKLTLYTRVKIGKAAFMFLARFLAGTSIDRVNLELQPAGLNPALAGISYGLNCAIAGMWPGFGNSFYYQPFENQAGERSKYSGEMEFSIPNRKILRICFQLLSDLPIWEITKTLYVWKKR